MDMRFQDSPYFQGGRIFNLICIGGLSSLMGGGRSGLDARTPDLDGMIGLRHVDHEVDEFVRIKNQVKAITPKEWNLGKNWINFVLTDRLSLEERTYIERNAGMQPRKHLAFDGKVLKVPNAPWEWQLMNKMTRIAKYNWYRKEVKIRDLVDARFFIELVRSERGLQRFSHSDFLWIGRLKGYDAHKVNWVLQNSWTSIDPYTAWIGADTIEALRTAYTKPPGRWC